MPARNGAKDTDEQADDAQAAEDDHGLIGMAANVGVAPLDQQKEQGR